MDQLLNWVLMSGHGVYVWPAYAVGLVTMGVFRFWVVSAHAQQVKVVKNRVSLDQAQNKKRG